MDDDIGTEEITVRLNRSCIDDGDLRYNTAVQSMGFKYKPWGSYDVLGFMADKYFAGYNDAARYSRAYSILKEGQIRRVLLDSDTNHNMTIGSALPLQEGYELRIKNIGVGGSRVWILMVKDGKEICCMPVTPSADLNQTLASTFIYQAITDSGELVPILAAHISRAVHEREDGFVDIDGIFQISDSPELVDEVMAFNRMKIITICDQGIYMENPRRINLERDQTIDLMGDIKLQVADSDSKCLVPVIKRIGDASKSHQNIWRA